MSAITNNNFANDTHALQEERLLAIQDNWANTSTLFTVPAALATWATTCHTSFANARAVAGAETAEAEAATVVVNQAIDALDGLYRSAHVIGEALFESDEDVFKKYKFDEPYPSRRIDKLNRIRIISEEHQRLVAANADLLMPTPLITQMTAAAAAAQAAISAQEGEKTEADDAQKDMRDLFESNCVKLRKLLLLWRGYRGLSDPLIGHIGMVNDAPPGGGNPPDATTITSYANGELTAAEVEDATSYEWQESADTNTWPADWTNLATPTWTVGLPTTANRYFRVRTRNVHGVSAVSPVFVVPAGAGFGAPTGLAHNFATGLTSWDAVAPAAPGEEVQYELHFRPTGSPTSNQIGITTDTFYANSPILGGTLMVRAMSGGQTSGWAELDV